MLIHDPYHVNELIDPIEMLEIEDKRVETFFENKNRASGRVIRSENNAFNIKYQQCKHSYNRGLLDCHQLRS